MIFETFMQIYPIMGMIVALTIACLYFHDWFTHSIPYDTITLLDMLYLIIIFVACFVLWPFIVFMAVIALLANTVIYRRK